MTMIPVSGWLVGLGALGGLVLLSQPARAANDGYVRLVPVDADPELNAAHRTDICTTLLRDPPPSDEATIAKVMAYCRAPAAAAIPSIAEMERAKTLQVKRLDLGGSGTVKGLAPFGSPDWQDALLRGIAAILVSRAKSEALAAVAENMKDDLCTDATATAVFPRVCGFLQASDPYGVPVSWGALKGAAEADLHDVPVALIGAALPRRTEALKDLPELAYVLVDGIDDVIRWRVPAPKLLYALRPTYRGKAKTCADNPAACALFTSGVLAQIAWPGGAEILRGAKGDAKLFTQIATGLLAQELKAAGVAGEATDLDGVAKALDQLLGALTALKDYDSKPLSPETGKQIESYVITFAGAAAAGTFGLTGKVFPDDQRRKLNRMAVVTAEAVRAALSADYLLLAADVSTLAGELAPAAFPPRLMRYLPLLAELASARTPDDMERIVTAAAAPVGSYRAKRGAGRHTIAINGYLGLKGGAEWLSSSTLADRGATGHFGLFAPVGVEASLGFGDASSIGLFLSVVDLGSLVDFRTEDTNTSMTSGSTTNAVRVNQEPTYELKQVFSPGLFVVLGLARKWPIVIGGGAALTPRLRRVELIGGGVQESPTAFQVSGFLAIDLTLFPF